MEPREVLQFEHVDVDFSDTHVLSDVSFSLYEGEILGIVGESGSGKSTILKAAMGLLEGGLVTRGDIWYDEKSIPDMSEKQLCQLRGAGIGMVFQDAGASLCPIRTIGSQIAESILAHENIEKEVIKKEAIVLFEKMHFQNPEAVWNQYPFELSGGMNQRVGIAIALLAKPEILLADEPTSALDVMVQREILREFLEIKSARNMSIVIVTHDINVVSAVADRVLVLKNGVVMEEGKTLDVLENPQNDYTKQLIAASPRLRRD